MGQHANIPDYESVTPGTGKALLSGRYLRNEFVMISQVSSAVDAAVGPVAGG